MSKYFTLVNILDKICEEARGTPYESMYNPQPEDNEKRNQARSRALIHLYLKVNFGILEFPEREKLITDGPYDGGIDGYFIDTDNNVIYLLQSKFRTSERNFENKDISLEELLVMDTDRVTKGEDRDFQGNEYNGKIKKMVREISNTEGIGRYRYKVIIIANTPKLTSEQLRRLSGGETVEIIDHDKCYKNLVFPVISGTYYNATDLTIHIDLSNKNAGSKISYTVQTKHHECEITVLFVPTLEIAKIMSRYKNSILRYNPRNYLEHEGQKVNSAIRQTITETATNEFALLNNGITMISDDTQINERIGKKNKAQLNIKNPQIINGGQTAYTLSKIYEENRDAADETFNDKEVLVKIITLNAGSSECVEIQKKLELIDQISTATNRQTEVIPADRISNEQIHLDIQNVLFTRYGILYERKRGEFRDGVNSGYINNSDIIERNLFLRVYLSANGSISKSAQKRLFAEYAPAADMINDTKKLDRFHFSYQFYDKITRSHSPSFKRSRDTYGKLYAITAMYFETFHGMEISDDQKEEMLLAMEKEWAQFIGNARPPHKKYMRQYIDKETGEKRLRFSLMKWLASEDYEKDLKNYFDGKEQAITPAAEG